MMSETRSGNPDRMSGYYLGICIALFSPMGIVLWLALDNPGFLGIGPALGVAIGVSLEGRNADRYSAHGGTGSKLAMVIALGCLAVGLLLALLLLL